MQGILGPNLVFLVMLAGANHQICGAYAYAITFPDDPYNPEANAVTKSMAIGTRFPVGETSKSFWILQLASTSYKRFHARIYDLQSTGYRNVSNWYTNVTTVYPNSLN